MIGVLVGASTRFNGRCDDRCGGRCCATGPIQTNAASDACRAIAGREIRIEALRNTVGERDAESAAALQHPLRGRIGDACTTLIGACGAARTSVVMYALERLPAAVGAERRCLREAVSGTCTDGQRERRDRFAGVKEAQRGSHRSLRGASLFGVARHVGELRREVDCEVRFQRIHHRSYRRALPSTVILE